MCRKRHAYMLCLGMAVCAQAHGFCANGDFKQDSRESLASLLNNDRVQKTSDTSGVPADTSCERLVDLVSKEIAKLHKGCQQHVGAGQRGATRGPKDLAGFSSHDDSQSLEPAADGYDSEPEEIRALRQSPNLEFILATQLETLSQLLMLGLATPEERADIVNQVAAPFILRGADVFFPFPYMTSEKYMVIFESDRIADLQGFLWESADAKRVSLIFLNYSVQALRVISGQQDKSLGAFIAEHDAQKRVEGSVGL